jgi:glutamyl-tRNA reductase
MHILCIGMNHQTSNLELREKFSFDDGKLEASLARVGCGKPEAGLAAGCIDEMVILSTCNRAEVYATSAQAEFTALEDLLAQIHQIPVEEFHPYTYQLADQEAVEHLLRVAAGLDSLVVGEPQILGQVAGALERAQELNTAGKLLSRLFYAAIRGGKRARAETAISQNAASIPSLAVRMAERSLSDIAASQVVILGAGEMAELAVEAFRKRGASKILVVNRTLERAQALASRWDGESDTFENLAKALLRADVLIASTSAPHTLVHSPLVAQAMATRPERPLVIIDIAVPRDVDIEVGQLPNVQLYDMDTLQAGLEQSLEHRLHEVPHVETILEEEQAAFMDYLRSLDLLPLIAGMRQKAESIRQRELEKTLRRLPGLSESERDRLEAMTQAMIQKILHDPIVRLRDEAGGPQAAEYAVLVRMLFGLDDPDGNWGVRAASHPHTPIPGNNSP